MNKLGIFLTILLTSQSSFGANMLYRQSFETPVESNPDIQWTSSGYPLSQAIVTHMPKHGDKSVRGNFNPNVIDPITKLKGDTFPHFVLNFYKIPALKSYLESNDNVYVSWWFKLDKCTWRGTSFSNSDPLQARGKFAYIRMDQHPESSYYFAIQGGDKGTGVFQANNDKWISLWQNWYKAAALWNDSSRPYGPDGEWHKLSFFIDKHPDGSKYLMWWIDEQLMRKEKYESTARYKIFDGFKMDSIQFWIAKTGDLNLSQEAGKPGNYCNGWQIDDVQIWDNIPNRPLPPSV